MAYTHMCYYFICIDPFPIHHRWQTQSLVFDNLYQKHNEFSPNVPVEYTMSNYCSFFLIHNTQFVKAHYFEIAQSASVEYLTHHTEKHLHFYIVPL